MVVFSFSKKQCEANADFFLGKDLLTQREKGRVGKLLNQVRCLVMMSLMLFHSDCCGGFVATNMSIDAAAYKSRGRRPTPN